MGLATIPEAIEDIKAGKFVIIVDDEDRENEGDLVMAAEKVTPEAINFMAKHGRGLICMPMTGQRLDELKDTHDGQQQYLQIRHRLHRIRRGQDGTSTGISAADRARTVQAIIDPKTKPEDIAHAGAHVPPARQGRRRAGAGRADRGDGRPGQDGRALPGRRLLRDYERRRHHGAAAPA